MVLAYFATAIFTLFLSENHNQVKHTVGMKSVNPIQGMNPSNYNCCLQQQSTRVIWYLQELINLLSTKFSIHDT